MARAELIRSGNEMQRRCWARYQDTLDPRDAARAEWWRERTEEALGTVLVEDDDEAPTAEERAVLRLFDGVCRGHEVYVCADAVAVAEDLADVGILEFRSRGVRGAWFALTDLGVVALVREELEEIEA